jgi:hypothetical protein
MAGLGRGRKITAAKKAPEAIEKAALLLEEKGWCTRTYQQGNRFCAWGALRAVSEGPAEHLAFSVLDEAACSAGYEGGLPAYNDSQTDKRKVIRFMRRVARQMRGAK